MPPGAFVACFSTVSCTWLQQIVFVQPKDGSDEDASLDTCSVAGTKVLSCNLKVCLPLSPMRDQH